MEALAGTEPCAGCGHQPAPKFPVSWSPAFGQHLCTDCRIHRTDAELFATAKQWVQAPAGSAP